MICKPIFLVWADRGDYSDRTEYAVCWFSNKEEAETRAKELQEKSAEQRRIIAGYDGDRYGEVWERAKDAVGDPDWSPHDDTDYQVVDLPHGDQK